MLRGGWAIEYRSFSRLDTSLRLSLSVWQCYDRSLPLPFSCKLRLAHVHDGSFGATHLFKAGGVTRPSDCSFERWLSGSCSEWMLSWWRPVGRVQVTKDVRVVGHSTQFAGHTSYGPYLPALLALSLSLSPYEVVRPPAHTATRDADEARILLSNLLLQALMPCWSEDIAVRLFCVLCRSSLVRRMSLCKSEATGRGRPAHRSQGL